LKSYCHVRPLRASAFLRLYNSRRPPLLAFFTFLSGRSVFVFSLAALSRLLPQCDNPHRGSRTSVRGCIPPSRSGRFFSCLSCFGLVLAHKSDLAGLALLSRLRLLSVLHANPFQGGPYFHTFFVLDGFPRLARSFGSQATRESARTYCVGHSSVIYRSALCSMNSFF